MSKIDNKSVSQALLDLDEMRKNLMEQSKETVKSLLKETIKESLNESIEDKEDEEDTEEYTIIDEPIKSDEKDKDKKETCCKDDKCSKKCKESDKKEDSDDEDSDEERSFADKYKDEDGNWDFSDVDEEGIDDTILKVFKSLSDEEDVVVRPDGDSLRIKDEKTGSEYIVCKDDDSDDESEDSESDDEVENIFEIEEDSFDDEEYEDFDDEEYEDFDDEEYEDFDDEEDDEFVLDVDEEGMDDDESLEPAGIGYDSDNEFLSENKFRNARKTMKKKNVLFEVDLGYTDDYQSKDPIDGLSAEEPAKDKRDWDKGVPSGTKKPWAGKGKSTPFTQLAEEDESFEIIDDVDDIDSDMDFEEVDEAVSKARKRSTSKSLLRQNEMNPKGTRHASKNGKYLSKVDENYAYFKKELAKLIAENKAIKKAAIQLKENYSEALLLNANLGMFVRLVQENTTTREEREDIINRLDMVKNINESKALYESISRELSKPSKKTVSIKEKPITVSGSKNINESKVYENPQLASIRQMMDRIDRKNFI